MPDPSSNQADKGLWHRWRPWLIVSLAVLATLALLPLVLVVLPQLLVPPGKSSFADLAKAESDVRGNLVAALGVLAVLIGATVGFLNFREIQHQNRLARQKDRDQLELTRRGQVNERFSKAIEQLGQSGDDKVDVRIGAVYSLEQIARDAPEELHGPVVEILTAFLREHSRSSEERPGPDYQQARPPAATAALDVRAHLDNAILWDAHLEKADLTKAHLDKADLTDAHLEGARLTGAYLEEADLTDANLKEANLEGAHLERRVSGTRTWRGQSSVASSPYWMPAD